MVANRSSVSLGLPPLAHDDAAVESTAARHTYLGGAFSGYLKGGAGVASTVSGVGVDNAQP